MARFRNRPIRCLLDSGCERSVIGRRYAKGMQLKRSKYELFAANKTSLPVDGDVDIHVTIDGHPMTANHGRRIHRSWGGHIPPLFLHRGVSGYINSLQLFNNTTCLQSCNVVFPALRHSTAIITLVVAYAYIETRQLYGDCGYIKLPCQQDMFTNFFLPRYHYTALH